MVGIVESDPDLGAGRSVRSKRTQLAGHLGETGQAKAAAPRPEHR